MDVVQTWHNLIHCIHDPRSTGHPPSPRPLYSEVFGLLLSRWLRSDGSQNMVAASCTLEPPKASESIPCIRSSHSTPRAISSSGKSPGVRLQQGLCPRHVSQSGSATSPVPDHRAPRAARDTTEGIASEGLFPSRAPPPRRIGSNRDIKRSDRSGASLTPPPEGGTLDSKTHIFHHRHGGGERPTEVARSRPTRPSHPSRSDLNVTSPARTTPASRTACDCKHFSPSPSARGTVRQYSRRRWRASWGPTRRSLAPAANTSPRPPLHEVRFDNTEGAASRKAITSSSDTMRPSANRPQDQPATPPAPTRGNDQSHDHAGPQGSATHKTGLTQQQPLVPIGTVGRVAPRPAAATQK